MSFATHPLFALVPGQEAALSREVVEGERIQVEGPPSSQRHPGLNDPQRNENSAEGADSLLQSRRRIPDGVYQACRKRWLATRFPSASLDELAAKVRAKYEELVLGPIQWPRLVGIDVEPMTLVYPAGYGSKATPQQIRTRRLNVRAVDGFGEERSVVAYYLNYDKVPLEHSRVILQVNGHFGANPSRMLIGLKGRGGISGATVARIALEGHPVIVYDDHDVGESSESAGVETPLARTLHNLRMIEDALLIHFDRVDVIGLSGGAERLYHFLVFNRCPVFSAYFSGFFSSPWMSLDNRKVGGPFWFNADTYEEAFLANFQWPELALVAIANGVDVRFAVQTYEGGKAKNCFIHEFLPTVKQYTDRFSVGGDDPDCDGVSNDGSEMAHEYHLPDYLMFLEKSLSQSLNSSDLVLHCRAVPEGGLALVDLDLTEEARHLGLLPLTFSRLSGGTGISAQFFPAPDFNPHTNVRGRGLIQCLNEGTFRLELAIGPGGGSMPDSWDGNVEREGFVVRHSAENGGFPDRIDFKESGNSYHTMRFNDRVHNGNNGGFLLRHDRQARIEKLSDGPLATVVRTRGTYMDESGGASGVESVYDWVYFRDSPRVHVDSLIFNPEARTWGEVHVLEVNFPDESFTGWKGGEPASGARLQADKGQRRFSSWAALVNKVDSIALYRCGTPLIYDGRGDYGTYLHAHGNSAWGSWSGKRRRFSSWFWLGGADQVDGALPEVLAVSGTAQSYISLDSVEAELARREGKLEELQGGERREAQTLIAVARRRIAQGRPTEAASLLEEEDVTTYQTIEAGDLQLTIEVKEDGVALQSLRDARTSLEFLSPDTPALFTLDARDTKSGKEVKLHADRGWNSIRMQPGGKEIRIEWGSPAAEGLEALSVTAVAVMDAHANALRWKLSVRNDTVDWSVYHATFPQVSIPDLGREGCVFFPRAPGEVGTGIWSREFKHEGLYPEPWTTMQYVAAYPADGRAGLYVAAHDPSGSPKRITIESNPRQGAVAFTYENPAADMSRPGNDYKTHGEVVWRIFRGDWFDASVLYRDWVRAEAKWFPKLGRRGRGDTPQWMKELPVWVNRSGEFSDVVEQTKKFAERMGVPVGLHWYFWHQIPFDNDYPHYFPPREDFAEHVVELQEAGIYCMPYINGRLWDTRDKGAEDFQFTRIALPAATKDKEGKPYTESYGSTEEDGSLVTLAVMCPSTKLWQERVGENCRRLFDECGVDGVYIDQVAAMSPRMCMDRSHGHPLGGGTWWNEGYWKMHRAIREEMPDGAMLTTECNAEPFAHVFDGYLTWTWQHDGQVPAFMTVYGGVLQMFGRQYGGPTEAKRMKCAQQFVFGEQLGWMWPDEVDSDQSFIGFLRDCVQLRWKLKQYFAEGRMARPPKILSPVPEMTADWRWANQENWLVTHDVLFTGAWQLPEEDKTVLLFANAGEEPVRARVRINAKEYGLHGKRILRQKLTSDGPGEAPREVEIQGSESVVLGAFQALAIEYSLKE